MICVYRYADYVTVLTFDYHTASSDNVTGLNAPLYQPLGDYGKRLNIVSWLQHDNIDVLSILILLY